MSCSIRVHEIPGWDKVLLNSLLSFDLSGAVENEDLSAESSGPQPSTSVSSLTAGVDEFTWLGPLRGTKWCWKTASHPSLTTGRKAEAIDVDRKKKAGEFWRGILIARTCAGDSWEIKTQGSSLILTAHTAFISYYWCLKCTHCVCVFPGLEAHLPVSQRTQTASPRSVVYFNLILTYYEVNGKKRLYPLASLSSLTWNTSITRTPNHIPETVTAFVKPD